MAHWTDYLRRKISEQERLIALLSSAAKENAVAVKQLDEVESRRAVAVKRICSLEVENSRLRSENLSLGKQIIEQDVLLEELVLRDDKIRVLEKQLNRRSGLEDPYGLATPSSKRVTKRNSTAENQAKRGGARPGHKGNGRESFSPGEADLVVHVDDASPRCSCGCEWVDAGTAESGAGPASSFALCAPASREIARRGAARPPPLLHRPASSAFPQLTPCFPSLGLPHAPWHASAGGS